jgi:hypothetical protein
MMVVLLTFCLLSTTVLTQPTVAQVKEVCGLMHNLAVLVVRQAVSLSWLGSRRLDPQMTRREAATG